MLRRLVLVSLLLLVATAAHAQSGSGACADANGCFDWCVDGCHGILLTVAFSSYGCGCTCVYLHSDGSWHEHNMNKVCHFGGGGAEGAWDFSGCDAPGYTALRRDDFYGDYYTCCVDINQTPYCAEPWNSGGGEQ